MFASKFCQTKVLIFNFLFNFALGMIGNHDICSICLEDFNLVAQNTDVTFCPHCLQKFHKLCFFELFENKARENCPLCRREIIRFDYFGNQLYFPQNNVYQPNNLHQPFVDAINVQDIPEQLVCCCHPDCNECAPYCPCCGQFCCWPCCEQCCWPCCAQIEPYCPYVALTSSYIGYMIGLVFAFLHATNLAYPIFSLLFYIIFLLMQIWSAGDCWKASFIYLLSLFLLILSFTTSSSFIVVGSIILAFVFCIAFGPLLANLWVI